MRFRSICPSENSSRCPISSARWLLKVLHNNDTQRKIPSIPGKIPRTEIDFCNNEKDKSSIYYCNKRAIIIRKNSKKNIKAGELSAHLKMASCDQIQKVTTLTILQGELVKQSFKLLKYLSHYANKSTLWYDDLHSNMFFKCFFNSSQWRDTKKLECF